MKTQRSFGALTPLSTRATSTRSTRPSTRAPCGTCRVAAQWPATTRGATPPWPTSASCHRRQAAPPGRCVGGAGALEGATAARKPPGSVPVAKVAPMERQDTCPLPQDPTLAATAVAMRDAGHWGEIYDRDWRIVYMTDELRASSGLG